MSNNGFKVRNAKESEFREIGELMVTVYSQLEGFPKKSDQPDYYKKLANIGDLTKNPETELVVAVSSTGKIEGAVVYINDMKYYGSGDSATSEKNAAGFRFLAVDPSNRGKGIGKALTRECLEKARNNKRSQLIIHSTEFMKIAWKMYESMGFRRSEDLDFMQVKLPVFGFRLPL